MAEQLYRKKRDGKPYGSWFGWVYTPQGERVPINTRTKNKNEARRVLRDAQRNAPRGAVRETERQAEPPSRPAQDDTKTVEDALRYLVEYAEGSWSRETLRMFAQKGGHLLRLIGDIKLSELSTADTKHYADRRIKEGASRSSVGKELTTLRTALREASDLGWLPPGFNVASVVIAFKTRYKPRRRWLRPDEAQQLALALAPKRRLWFYLCLYTSSRASIVERIHWEDIDLDAGWLRIPGTKTRRSDRWVPIPAPLSDLLSDVPKSDRQGTVAPRWSNHRRDLALACDRIGVDRVSSNDIRRTYASWLKNAGTDSAIVAKLLGHSSTRMVDLVYGQLADQTLAQAIEVLPDVTQARPATEPVRSNCVAKPSPATRQKRPMRQTPRAPKASPTAMETPTSRDSAVPRDRIELPTRGFSVRVVCRWKARTSLGLSTHQEA